MFTKFIVGILYWLKAHDFGLNIWSITAIFLTIGVIGAFLDCLRKKGEKSTLWAIVGGLFALLLLVICASYILFELTGAW